MEGKVSNVQDQLQKPKLQGYQRITMQILKENNDWENLREDLGRGRDNCVC